PVDLPFGGPHSICIPRFRNLDPTADATELGFCRGYGLWGAIQRRSLGELPGGALCILFATGEMLPRPENRLTLAPELKDAFGIPAVRIDCSYSENARAM